MHSHLTAVDNDPSAVYIFKSYNIQTRPSEGRICETVSVNGLYIKIEINEF